MRIPRFQSITDQVTAYLREELSCGRWTGEMPGQNHLVDLLTVSNKTVELALRQLEVEGVLVGQGAGRKRRIVTPDGGLKRPSQQVAVLDYETVEGIAGGWVQGTLNELTAAGHDAFMASKTLIEMKMDVSRIARLVKKTDANAWIVWGASREVLEWFANQSVPAFAGFGRMDGVPIAGVKPDKISAMSDCVQKLLSLGHRRIVMLKRSEHRFPNPSRIALKCLEELEAHGIATSSYNLPDWEETPEGFCDMLGSLFGHTPPTALIADGAHFFYAAHHFLSQHKIRVPQDVSLVSTNGQRDFWWLRPTVAHFDWDEKKVVRRMVKWVNNVARGREDLRQSLTKAKFIDGGTIGPAKKGR